MSTRINRETKNIERILPLKPGVSWLNAKKHIETAGMQMTPTKQDPYSVMFSRRGHVRWQERGNYWTGGILVCQDPKQPFETRHTIDRRTGWILNASGIPIDAEGKTRIGLFVAADAISAIRERLSEVEIIADPTKVRVVNYLVSFESNFGSIGKMDPETGVPMRVSRDEVDRLRLEQKTRLVWPLGKTEFVRPIARHFPLSDLDPLQDLHERFGSLLPYTLNVGHGSDAALYFAAARVEFPGTFETLIVDCRPETLTEAIQTARTSLGPLANALGQHMDVESINTLLRDIFLMFKILDMRKGTELFRLDLVDLEILLQGVKDNIERLSCPPDKPLFLLCYPDRRLFDPLRELVNLLEPVR